MTGWFRRISPLLWLTGTLVFAGPTADLPLIHAILGEDQQPGIAHSVAEIRGVNFKRVPVPVRAPSTLRQVLADVAVAEVLNDSTLAARGAAWHALGLGDGDSPRRLWRLLARDVGRIAFDASTHQLFVDPDLLTVRDFAPTEGDDGAMVLQMTGVRPDEPLIAHVLVHAMQAERNDSPPLAATTDGLLAGVAMREAEANLVAIYMRFRGLGVAGEILRNGIPPEILRSAGLLPPELEEASDLLERLAEFVYLDGLEIATTHLQQGGWGAFDLLQTQRSTYGLLMTKPGEPATPVTLPDLPGPPGEGWRRVDSDVLGSVAIGALLALGSGTETAALELMPAWRGDRLTHFVIESSDQAWTRWVCRWADAEAAQTFVESYRRVLARRFPDGEWAGEGDDIRVQTAVSSYRLQLREQVLTLDIRSH